LIISHSAAASEIPVNKLTTTITTIIIICTQPTKGSPLLHLKMIIKMVQRQSSTASMDAVYHPTLKSCNAVFIFK
jgi:hypothetical protein